MFSYVFVLYGEAPRWKCRLMCLVWPQIVKSTFKLLKELISIMFFTATALNALTFVFLSVKSHCAVLGLIGAIFKSPKPISSLTMTRSSVWAEFKGKHSYSRQIQSWHAGRLKAAELLQISAINWLLHPPKRLLALSWHENKKYRPC